MALDTLDTEALRQLLCQRLCGDVRVQERPDGALMLRTNFHFPDGDRYPIHLCQSPAGGLRLSDRGHTLMHISYEHDVDAFLEGTRGMVLERIINEAGLCWDGDGGALCLDTVPERLPEALFTFGQALTRVYDLTLLSRSNVRSTFDEDLNNLLLTMVDEEKIERNHQPDVPNGDCYLVDYRIENKSDTPLFLYGVPNRDKARLTTIMLSHFHRHELRFASILVFENQSKLPRVDLARLSDVGGEMVSSLASRDALKRKVLERM